MVNLSYWWTPHLPNDDTKYEVRTLKRGSVDFTIQSFRNGILYGLRIDRSNDPSEEIQFCWIKDGVEDSVFYWDHTSPESTEELHKFCRLTLVQSFQEDLLSVRVVAEKAMRCVYHQLCETDIHLNQTSKNRLPHDLFDHIYYEDYSDKGRNNLITFLILEEGLGLGITETLMYYLSLLTKEIKGFLKL